jgi:hypothetical protein
VWDFRAGAVPLHERMPDPVEQVRRSPLRLIGTTRWRWPWRFSLIQRIEFARTDQRGASEGEVEDRRRLQHPTSRHQ